MSATGEEVVRLAQGWIGTPYCHQAATRGAGTDCLGLIRGIWCALYGAEPEPVPAYSMDWSEPDREERLWQAALRHLEPALLDHPALGDVLLFRMREGHVAKHLGIQSRLGGRPTFIHAYAGRAVLESPLSQPWARRIVARFRFPEKETC